ncbi:MAG: cobalamin B12-binding domain-containing protein [Phycisphaerae bacterium]
MTRHERIRIVIGKPGLDGHDVGAKVVARALMEAGFEVVYTGLRKSPEEIVAAACEADADVLGLSILSGTHLPICERVRSLLQAAGRSDMVWIVGGNIPAKDHDALKQLGVKAVFSVGTSPQSIADFIRGAFP